MRATMPLAVTVMLAVAVPSGCESTGEPAGNPERTPPCPTTPPRPDNTIDATRVTTGVHVEQHEKFDRVIYDFGGTFTPGWRAEYVAEATPRGQAISTPIDGRSILQIYFFDTVGASEREAGYNGPNPLTAPITGTVTEYIWRRVTGAPHSRSSEFAQTIRNSASRDSRIPQESPSMCTGRDPGPSARLHARRAPAVCVAPAFPDTLLIAPHATPS